MFCHKFKKYNFVFEVNLVLVIVSLFDRFRFMLFRDTLLYILWGFKNYFHPIHSVSAGPVSSSIYLVALSNKWLILSDHSDSGDVNSCRFSADNSHSRTGVELVSTGSTQFFLVRFVDVTVWHDSFLEICHHLIKDAILRGTVFEVMLQSRNIFLVNTLQSNEIVTVGAIPNCHGFRDLSEIFAPWPFYVALSLICLFLLDFSLRNKKVPAELGYRCRLW